MKDTILKDIFEEANDLFDERNESYGNTFESDGSIVSIFFPNGITLKTDSDFKRFLLFSSIIGKLNRYANNFEEGHRDSIQDAAVYSHMLDFIDRKNRL